ncbi:uncharacterized protein ACDP82_008163 isoform 4-T4 [Pangshura tecta]
MDPTYPLTSHRAKRFAAAGSCTRQHLLRASLTKLTGAPLSDKNMDLIGIIQYPWKPWFTFHESTGTRRKEMTGF